MVLKIRKPIVLFLILFFAAGSFLASAALAIDPKDVGTIKSICDDIKNEPEKAGKLYMPCAKTPADCGNTEDKYPPPNCLFLQEPIGGEEGYDLYMVKVSPDPKKATSGSQTTRKLVYTSWHGEYIDKRPPPIGKGEAGPVQAILTYEEGKEYQGPFGLLYNYVQLIYKFMSGIIVGFVVLISIIGGIRISTSQGADEAEKGKKMIIKALVGMALWFLASLVLYTINPTFFAF